MYEFVLLFNNTKALKHTLYVQLIFSTLLHYNLFVLRSKLLWLISSLVSQEIMHNCVKSSKMIIDRWLRQRFTTFRFISFEKNCLSLKPNHCFKFKLVGSIGSKVYLSELELRLQYCRWNPQIACNAIMFCNTSANEN